MMNWLMLEYTFTYLVFIVGILVIGYLTLSVLLKAIEWMYLKYFFQRFRRNKK